MPDTREFTGALIAGLSAAILGWPGLIIGLIAAFVYYGRSK